MPDLWLDVDTEIQECPVNILPLTDDTDFKSRETAVAYNATGMDLVWNFITCAGAFTQTAVTPATGSPPTDYAWVNQGDGMYTIDIPASGGATINNDTEGFGWFSGVATGVLPWRGPICGFRAAALNNALIDGGDLLDVNVTHIADTSQTARDIGASVLLSSGTGTGQVTLTSGRVNADVTHIATAAVNTASAQLGVNVVNFGGSAGTFASGVPSVVLTTAGVNAVADQVWDADITGHGAANSAGAAIQPVRSAACQNGGDTTHVILDSSASATTDAYKY